MGGQSIVLGAPCPAASYKVTTACRYDWPPAKQRRTDSLSCFFLEAPLRPLAGASEGFIVVCECNIAEIDTARLVKTSLLCL